MNGLLQAMKAGFRAGKQQAKREATMARIQRNHNPKVIVFETTGEIRIATLNGDMVCRKNLTDYQPCPEEILSNVPTQIVEFCQETAPHYLYLVEDNGEIKWESTREDII